MIVMNDVLLAAPALQKLTTQDMPLYAACAVADLLDLCNPILDAYGYAVESGGSAEELRHKIVPQLKDFSPFGMDPMLPVLLSAADVKRLEPFIDFGRRKYLSNSDNS